jgi:hypothetical protein
VHRYVGDSHNDDIKRLSELEKSKEFRPAIMDSLNKTAFRVRSGSLHGARFVSYLGTPVFGLFATGSIVRDLLHSGHQSRRPLMWNCEGEGAIIGIGCQRV